MTGVSKGGFGGVSGTAVPMMALVMSPTQAAGVMLPILMVMDALSLWTYRGGWDWRNLRLLIPGAVVGIGIGTVTVGMIDDDVVRVTLGVIAVAFTLYSLLKPQGIAMVQAGRGFTVSGLLSGCVAGFTSFVAHAGSPPVQVHMLPQRLDPRVFVATAVMFFTVINAVKLVPYAALGLLSPGNLWLSLILVPFAPIGVMTGIWLNKVLPVVWFYRIVYSLMLVLGIKLIWDGLT